MSSQVLIDLLRELFRADDAITQEGSAISTNAACAEYDRIYSELRAQVEVTPATIPDTGELERLVTEQVKHAYYERKTITEAVEEIVSALQASAMVVPDGYALVLIEPTIEMAESMYFDGEDYTNSKDFDDFKIAWPRLLAVAASGDSQ